MSDRVKANDLRIGEKVGCLEIVGRAPNRGKKAVWVCRCCCGRTKEVYAGNLVRRPADRCTCSRKMSQEERAIRKIYDGIVARTENPKKREYRYYGARGIKMCPRWRLSFANFISDMGPRPSPGHSVDRIDPNGDYCPENCRWATTIEQARNTTLNHRLTYFGLTLPISAWAERVGIGQSTIRRRISVFRWPVGLALFAPPLTRGELRKLQGGRHDGL